MKSHKITKGFIIINEDKSSFIIKIDKMFL
jgi:hypothetical protein